MSQEVFVIMKHFFSVLFLVFFSFTAQAQGKSLPDFTELVDKHGAAVVNISTTQVLKSAGRSTMPFPFDEDDPISDLFRRFMPKQPGVPGQPGVPREFESRSLGSGFIVSADGYILTNAHVVDSADEILVRLTDKREFKAKVIGADKRTDVALIKIEASGLPAVRMGDPSVLKVGEWVLASGSPFGFDNSVTAGIVSAKGRSLPNENYTPFIQTDVAINPGNSGGPLFNLRGQVVGINSQIYSRSGGFMGISFAIPIDVAMNVAEQLKTTGKVQRGRLGVVIQEVSYDLAKSFGLEKASGALVSQVIAGGPAAKAGLQVGDIVQSVNGEEVKNSSDLPVMVGITAPGKEITLGIWRNGKSESVKVTLDSMGSDTAANNPAGSAAPDGSSAAGFQVPSLGLGLQQSQNGLVVINSQGLAAQAGLRRGDVIVAVGQTSVSDEDSFNKAVAAAGKNIPLLVKRGSNTLFLALTLQ